VVLAVLVLGLALALGAARLGGALAARTRAQTAADAAALAAADFLALGRDAARATTAAAETAEANGASLVRCDCGGRVATVTVAVAVPVLGRVARATARADVRGVVLPAP